MKFSKYPSYKSSSVNWLSEIPSHWELQSIKSLLVERIEKNNPIKTKDILSLTMDRGVIPYNERGGGGNKAKEDISSYKLAYPNDIVLNSMNIVAGSVGLSKYFGAVSPVYYMLYPRNENVDILYYNKIFSSTEFQKSLLGLGNGILMKETESSGKLNTIRMKIPMGKLNSQYLPLPPLDEQRKISQFLEKQILRIDGLIQKQEELIELFKAKRFSEISTAITKGIKKSVVQKNINSKWLIEIPAHWEFKKFKYLVDIFASNVDKKTVEGQTAVKLCNYTDVYYNETITENLNFMQASATEDQLEKFQLKSDDVIITKDSEGPNDIGVAAYVPKDIEGVICGYHLSMVRPKNNVSGAFIKRLLDSSYVKSSWMTLANGVTRYGLGKYAIDNLYVPTPPYEEQLEIASYLDDLTNTIDTLILKAKETIELLKEHRSTLIYAAVTGKIDVREAT